MINIFQAVLGGALALFIPGYLFLFALMPENELDLMERVVYGFGLSMVIVVFSALIMDRLGILLTAQNMAITLITFSIVCGGVGRYRQRMQRAR